MPGLRCPAESPEAARFDLRENLRLFPVDLRQFPTDLRDRPEADIDLFANRFGLPKNRTALPLHMRCPGHFSWTLCSFELVTAAGQGIRSVSGADFLLAYWMARCFLGDAEASCSASSPEGFGAAQGRVGPS